MTEPEAIAAPEGDLLARIVAALRGLAAGDAIGRATEHYQPDEIDEVYEDRITDFVTPVRLFDHQQWAEAETGPPTEIVLALAAGDAPTAIRWHDDATAIDRLPVAVALGLSRPVGQAVAAAGEDAPLAAVAAAMAAALAGMSARVVVEQASAGALAAGGTLLAARILEAVGVAQGSGGRRAGLALYELFPADRDAEAATALICGLVYAAQSARRVIIEAVSLGGHAPTIAAIAGAICAAITPSSLPDAWGQRVEATNSIDLAAVAARYATRRGTIPPDAVR